MKNLVSLDLSNFDTSSLVSIPGMFFGCDKLESINLSSFSNSKIIAEDYMSVFKFCRRLQNLVTSNPKILNSYKIDRD